MSFFGNVGRAITKAVKNPLQPITHAAGKTVGLTANLHTGVHADLSRILTAAMAATGNPAAVAALAGNAVNSIAPRSTLGHLGGTVGTYAPIVAGATGGLSGLTKLPGVGAVTAKLSSIPGVSSVGTHVGALLGLDGAAGGAPGVAADDGYGGVAGESASTAGAMDAAHAAAGGGILGKVGSMLGLGDNMSAADKIALAKMGIDTVGGIASGISSANDRAKQFAETQRQFNLPTAAAAARSLANAPLRNAGAAGAAGYAAAGPPAAFKPHDIFTPGGEGPGQAGGYDPTAVAAGSAAYKPNPALDDTYRRILQMTGFGGAA